ncbi:diaminopimelate epimerase [Rothia aerolata]|uniref:Diaminopimelate epimerase n=1 Tax=Rothia aerolata TaxID=1812262 RepID=A0A917IVA9_9MICC|nr:diaminopimelate epimerase [Rothia aerolata]GGH63652.1 diaminopimelate epimerase [Rothia aerolata]
MTEQQNRWGDLTGVSLTKGHGTGNDFVFVTDPDTQLDLTPELVAAVCDRHFGIGADGFIRAAKTSAINPGVEGADDQWFMDYRNADGSISEMCGNGVRAFVEYLVTEKLIDLAEGERVQIGTRAGIKTVGKTETGYAIDMGPWGFIDGDAARENGSDATVSARGLHTPRPALSITMGNPHTVVMLGSDGKLDGLGLETAPKVTPTPPEGTNVEFVVTEEIEDTIAETGETTIGAIRMRVHERGVGETLSCGTGACAAAAATRFWGGEDAPDEWLVYVPGGTLAVTFVLGPDELEHVVLAGPAEMVGKVVLV